MIGFISFKAFSAFQLLYMTLAIDKIDRCGLSNTRRHECWPRRLYGNVVLATEETPDSSNKMELFSYKGDLANA